MAVTKFVGLLILDRFCFFFDRRPKTVESPVFPSPPNPRLPARHPRTAKEGEREEKKKEEKEDG
jgi:hypothetical protein